MAEKIQPIKSLDELETGDVVHIRVVAGESLGPHIVGAIGDVPEHEKEVLLYLLYEPEINNSKIPYEIRTIRESESSKYSFMRMKREDLRGWKYVGIITL